MPQSDIAGDLNVGGTVSAAAVVSGSPSITNDMIATPATPALGIGANKVRHQHVTDRSLANQGATPAAVRQVLRVVRGTTGTILRLDVGVVNAITAGSVTVDLYKNGVSVLTATVTLNTGAGTGGTAYDKATASFSSTTLAQGDVLEVVGTVSGPTGGGGWYAQLTTLEDYA